MRVILGLITIAITGCTTLSKSPQTLHEAFERYQEAVVSGTVVANRAEFFAPEVLSKTDINSETDTEALKLGEYLANEHSHYEKTEQRRGCLTVNGYGDNADPVSLFIEYKMIDGKWLISYTRLYLPQKEGFKGFYEKALCPDEAHDEIMRLLHGSG
jgi:hypothetical protein